MKYPNRQCDDDSQSDMRNQYGWSRGLHTNRQSTIHAMDRSLREKFSPIDVAKENDFRPDRGAICSGQENMRHLKLHRAHILEESLRAGINLRGNHVGLLLESLNGVINTIREPEVPTKEQAELTKNLKAFEAVEEVFKKYGKNPITSNTTKRK